NYLAPPRAGPSSFKRVDKSRSQARRGPGRETRPAEDRQRDRAEGAKAANFKLAKTRSRSGSGLARCSASQRSFDEKEHSTPPGGEGARNSKIDSGLVLGNLV